MKAIFLLLLLAGMTAHQAMAQTVVYESCTDATGKTVAAQMDVTLDKIVQSGLESGQPVIRYNPRLLPRLSAKGRLFFFAQECARFTLGQQASPLTTLQAHQSDCLGLATLIGSGLLADPADVKELQSSLAFPPEEWPLLPGPQRSFDFANCSRHSAIKRPPPDAPTMGQMNWNACVRACGDRLRRCQKACAGEACVGSCVTTYDACETGCEHP